MTKEAKWVAVIAAFWFGGEARVYAEPRDDFMKQQFAARLRRGLLRAEDPQGPSIRVRSGARAGGAFKPPLKSRDAFLDSPPVLKRGSLFASASGSQPLGVAAATPVVASGQGTGRDAFVETLYSQILNRDPAQNELDYWTRLLARGFTPYVVATAIWHSQEHRSLMRSHMAPDIPLRDAYRSAYFRGLLNKQR